MGCGIGPLNDFWVGDERFELRYAQTLMKYEVVSDKMLVDRAQGGVAGEGTHSELPLLLPRHNRLLLLVLVLLVTVDDLSLASLSIRTHAIDL